MNLVRVERESAQPPQKTMIIEHWTDDRLDQLADDVDNLRVSVADLRATAEIMLQTQLQHQRNFEIVVTEIRDIRADIQGLQLENRRMLEELRDKRDDEDT